MMARRTRRMSSSLLPLNITPAMTSIHPPAWWNGPLGPLTSGRDLYVVDLLCPADPVRLAARPDARAEARPVLRRSRDQAGHLPDGRRGQGGRLPDGCRAQGG